MPQNTLASFQLPLQCGQPAAGVLRAVALLNEVPGGPGLKRRAVGAHVVGEPVVAVPECPVVLLRTGEEAPDLRIPPEDVVHMHGLLLEIIRGAGISYVCSCFLCQCRDKQNQR